MDFNNLKKSVVVFSLLISSTILAQSSRNSTQTRLPRSSVQAERSQPIALSVALQNGYTSLQSNSVSASGGMTELLINASYTTRVYAVDLGAGYMSSDLTGSAAGSSSGLQNFEMTTQSFLMNFSPQYRLSESVQIGPVLQLLLGGDVGFKPGIGSTGQTSAWLGGAQAFYAFNWEKFRIKAGLTYVRSLNIEEKNLQSIQASLQLGLPIL